jgi:3-methyladenine DNA glycosylase AlkC
MAKKKTELAAPKKKASKKVPPGKPKVASTRKVADVSQDVINAIHRGERSTSNLVEALAIDPFMVAKLFLARTDRYDLFPWVDEARAIRPAMTLPAAVLLIGAAFATLRESEHVDDAFLALLAGDRSDVVRSFACFALANRKGQKLPRKLTAIKPLAADEHFGVREFAWMAVRPHVALDLATGIRELAKWTGHADANVRRFASEVTRPRGVWCRHIEALKHEPELALPILEPLRADPSEYVRASVGNWLNDASKSRPDFVRDLCDRWSRDSPIAETQAICRKALRTLEKG